MKKLTALLFLILAAAMTHVAAHSQSPARVDRAAEAERVKAEFLHAWNDYKKYAWSNDDLKHMSKSHHNWYAEPLPMSRVGWSRFDVTWKN